MNEEMPAPPCVVCEIYAAVLREHMSPEQLASAREHFEAICEQRGWLPLLPPPPCVLPDAPPP
jgi:hypothetical protein